MQQVLDSDSPILALKWKHRNPVFVGWIVGLMVLIAMSVILLGIGFSINRKPVTIGDSLSMFLPLVVAILFLLFLLLPSISAMHLFKRANEVATYNGQFNTAFKASYVPNILAFSVISLSNGTLNISNGAETLGALIAIFILAAILSLITSSILALFFRKRALSLG